MIDIECTRCLNTIGWRDADGNVTIRCVCGEKNMLTMGTLKINMPVSDKLTPRVSSNGSTHPDSAVRRCWYCSKVLLFAYEFTGRIEMMCRRCRRNNVWTGDDKAADAALGRYLFEAYRPDIAFGQERLRLLGFKSEVVRPTMEKIIEVMEQRWDAAMKTRSLNRAKVAVGLRFDVFARDGFRCMYCGIGAGDGALLHADHVIPVSKGGKTTMDNLVTACIDCNLGKSNKELEAARA